MERREFLAVTGGAGLFLSARGSWAKSWGEPSCEDRLSRMTEDYVKDGLSERVARQKARFLLTPSTADIERARCYTRAWKRAEGAGPAMLAALGLAETLRHQTIRIEDDALLCGVLSNKPGGKIIAVERGNGPRLTAPHLVAGAAESGNQGDRGRVSAERREWREEILPYWKGKTVVDLKRKKINEAGVFRGPPNLGPGAWPGIARGIGGAQGLFTALTVSAVAGIDEIRDTVQDILPDLICINLDLQGHTIPGYKRVLEIGFKGIGDRADKGLAELDRSDGEYERKQDFFQAASLAAKAVCDYAERYARLAEETAKKADEPRKSELLAMAERVRRSPALPPRTFMEALQAMWLTHVTLEISYGYDNIFSPGRVDQYLHPFYKADVEAGRLTREQALEAIEEYFIKLSAEVIEGPNVLTIGGLGRDGDDATNEVSYLFLECLEKLKAMTISLPTRISGKTPREFLKKALEVHRRTAGIAFYNDEVVIPDLVADGFSLDDARDYGVIGCVEPSGAGNCFSYTAGNGFLMLAAVELALNRGRRVLGDDQVMGVETPDPRTFKSFDDVKQAFHQQLAYITDRAVLAAELKDRAYAEAFPCLLLSSTIEGCLENGKDITTGGARYNHNHLTAQALASTANSLAAIKWAVFDEKIVTMEELVNACRTNFKFQEKLRRQLINKAPKFGNDDPEVDEIAKWVAETMAEETRKHKSWRGGLYRASLYSSATQHIEGAFIGATPDGRQAAQVVSNGISPANGTDRTGMTAACISSAKACKDAVLSCGVALNFNLAPGMLRTDEGIEKLADLVLAYFEMGGRHIQFNPQGADVLLDAQAHPENYPDLTVKVTGYSALYTELLRPLQDDIIARTEFRET